MVANVSPGRLAPLPLLATTRELWAFTCMAAATWQPGRSPNPVTFEQGDLQPALPNLGTVPAVPAHLVTSCHAPRPRCSAWPTWRDPHWRSGCGETHPDRGRLGRSLSTDSELPAQATNPHTRRAVTRFLAPAGGQAHRVECVSWSVSRAWNHERHVSLPREVGNGSGASRTSEAGCPSLIPTAVIVDTFWNLLVP